MVDVDERGSTMYVSFDELQAVTDYAQRVTGAARRSGRWVDVQTDTGTARRHVGEAVGVNFVPDSQHGWRAIIRRLYGGTVHLVPKGDGTVRVTYQRPSTDPHGGARVAAPTA